MVSMLYVCLLFVAHRGVVGQFPCPDGFKSLTGEPNCFGSTAASCSTLTCCEFVEFSKCDTHTCSTAGYELIDNAASTTCALGVCSDLQCCSIDPSRCLNKIVAGALVCNLLTGNFLDLKKNSNAHNDDIVNNCCSPWAEAQCQDWGVTTTCATGTFADPSKFSNVVGDIRLSQQDDYRTNCCSDRSTCASFSADGCGEGREIRSNSGNTKCSGDANSCDDSTCCVNKAGTCLESNVICPSGEVRGNYGSDAGSTPRETCCVDPFKCSAWTAEIDGASGLHQSLTAALAFFLAAVAIVA
jgi:hypothetical protein